jgi:hypothetical protein
MSILNRNLSKQVNKIQTKTNRSHNKYDPRTHNINYFIKYLIFVPEIIIIIVINA